MIDNAILASRPQEKVVKLITTTLGRHCVASHAALQRKHGASVPEVAEGHRVFLVPKQHNSQLLGHKGLVYSLYCLDASIPCNLPVFCRIDWFTIFLLSVKRLEPMYN